MLFRSDRDFAELADDRRIAFVGRVDRDRAIAQHRLGSCRGDRDIVPRFAQGDVPVFVLFDVFIGRPIRERVFEVPHVARNLDILDLEIADCGFEFRVPVHQPLAAIDEALVVKLDKDLDDGVVEIALFALGGVRSAGHGEGFACPVAACTNAFELPDDITARFPLLLPDLRDKGVAPHFLPGCVGLVLGQLAFGHHLGRNARMVGTGLPERVEALHPLPADQDILQCVVERVPHMQRTGDIRGRDHDAIGRRTGLGIGPGHEATGLFPRLVKAGFGGGCVECFVECHGL